jgi:four helix bundle protein
MATIKSFEELEVWKAARDLCKLVFEITSKEPLSKDYALKNQIKEPSGSVMDNIAEGFERGGRKEFIQFLGISKGSAGETCSQLIRASDQKYINQETFEKGYNLAKRVGKMEQGLIDYLNTTEIKGLKYKTANEPFTEYLTPDQINLQPETNQKP